MFLSATHKIRFASCPCRVFWLRYTVNRRHNFCPSPFSVPKHEDFPFCLRRFVGRVIVAGHLICYFNKLITSNEKCGRTEEPPLPSSTMREFHFEFTTYFRNKLILLKQIDFSFNYFYRLRSRTRLSIELYIISDHGMPQFHIVLHTLCVHEFSLSPSLPSPGQS